MQWKNPSWIFTKRTQVTLDSIALTPCYLAFIITTDVPEVYMHQFWNSICPRVQDQDFDALPTEEDTVSFLRDLGHSGDITLTSFVSPKHKSFGIDNKDFKKQEKMDYPRFTKVIIHHFLIQEKILSWRNKIGMHTLKDDYLINTLRFIARKEPSQIYGVVLPECLTSPKIKESKAYKTYLGHAIGVVPPKIARKFKKASPTKKDNDLVPVDEEPVTKGKRIKISVKKSSTKLATGIVIREPPVETTSKRKEKEKADVAHSKGIKLLFKVALTEKAQLKEVRKKNLRDFHKTHPSGSGIVSEKPPSVEKITPTVTSKGTGDKPGVPDVTENNSTESKSESWGNDEDESNNEQEASDEGSGQENGIEKQESDSEQDEESDDDNQEEDEVDQ
ncbi:hypothetical protein Tco_1076260 [Tanacetum coccineum]